MRNIWTIARREYALYFNSPLAYTVMLIVLSITGFVFALNIWFLSSQGGLGGGFAPDASMVTGLWWVYLFTVPTLTMRLIADEQRMGTIEILLTAPLREFELITGKWLGAFLFMGTTILFTFVFAILLNRLATPGIDQVQMLSGYLGLILFVGSLLALGTGISALFSNQFAAFFTTLFLFIVMWFLVGAPADIMPEGGEIFRYLSMGAHFDAFQSGAVALTNILYFLSLIALGLFIGTASIETRRWR